MYYMLALLLPAAAFVACMLRAAAAPTPKLPEQPPQRTLVESRA